MGADDQGLLDVGGFRGAGDEGAEDWRGEGAGEAVVGGVEVVDDFVGWHDQHEVLAEEVDDAEGKIAVVDPDGGVFGDGELAGEDGDVEVGQVVRAIRAWRGRRLGRRRRGLARRFSWRWCKRAVDGGVR